MSKNVERFRAGELVEIPIPDPKGKWVRYSDYEQLQATLTKAEQERTIAVRFLVKQGYARCAETAHGCDGWHPKL